MHGPEDRIADLLSLHAGQTASVAFSSGPWAVVQRLSLNEATEPVPLFIGGRLEEFPIGQAVTLAGAVGQDGQLAVSFPGGAKRVFFHAGNVVSASSTLKEDRLGPFVFARGLIDRQSLDRVTEEVERTGAKVGRVLVESGLLTPRGLYEAVRDQMEWVFRSLFAIERGTFVFSVGRIQESNTFRLPRPLAYYVLEGIRESDELRESLGRIRDRSIVLQRTRKTLPGGDASLAAVERELLSLMDGTSPASRIIARSGWSEATTLLGIARLLKAELVAPVSASGAAAPAKPAVAMVASVSQLLRTLNAALRSAGEDARALDGYFDSMQDPFKLVFGPKPRFMPTGELDVAAIERFLEGWKDSPEEGARYVEQALGDLLEFAVWIALDRLPDAEASRISELASELRASARKATKP